MDTAHLIDKANAVLSRVRDISMNLPLVPIGSRDIPPKTVKAYKELRFNAITAFGALLGKDPKFRGVVGAWLIEGGLDGRIHDRFINQTSGPICASQPTSRLLGRLYSHGIRSVVDLPGVSGGSTVTQAV